MKKPDVPALPSGKRLSPAALNERRRQAVQLRLEGLKLAEVSRRTHLSAPTVVAAHKAYLAGGWAAVDVKPRGRPALTEQALPPGWVEVVRADLLALDPATIDPTAAVWCLETISQLIASHCNGQTLPPRAIGRMLARWSLDFDDPFRAARAGAVLEAERWMDEIYPSLSAQAHREGAELMWLQVRPIDAAAGQRRDAMVAHTPRGKPQWLLADGAVTEADLRGFVERLLRVGRPLHLVVSGVSLAHLPRFSAWAGQNSQLVIFPAPVPWLVEGTLPRGGSSAASHAGHRPSIDSTTSTHSMDLTHLQRLEAESIHIMREVVAECDNPVMLYSIGKDSAVMLHLAVKAFYPAKPPFPLLHVDTTWKFRDMYAHRDRMARESGMELLVHVNSDGLKKGINPFTHGSAIHTDVMKTEGLKQALDKYGFDAAFGGARRDEEKSRAKERIFSFRSAQHRWDPKSQRPELWRLYNARKHKGESIRVFPLSNWTELDVWQYIWREGIPVVPLYLAAERPVVERNGALIMVDDDRMPLRDGEVPMLKKVRFRTLGCYPLTGAVESSAESLTDVIREMLLARTSERQGRVIDHDQAASMEKKKQEGYF